MVKILFLFDEKIPKGSTFKIEGFEASCLTATSFDGLQYIQADLEEKENGIFRAGVRILSSAVQSVVGISGGQTKTKIDVEWKKDKEIEKKSWYVQWKKDSKNMVAIFLARDFQESSIANAVRPFLKFALTSNDKHRVEGAISDIIVNKTLSIHVADTTEENIRVTDLCSIFREDNFVDELLSTPLGTDCSALGRLLVSSSTMMMPILKGSKLAAMIVSLAPRDIITLIREGQLDRSRTYYEQIPREYWGSLCAIRRLAIVMALKFCSGGIPSGLQFKEGALLPPQACMGLNLPVGSQWGSEGMESWNAENQSSANVQECFSLAIAVHRFRRNILPTTRSDAPITSSEEVVGPYCTGVASIICLPNDSKDRFQGKWRERDGDRFVEPVGKVMGILMDCARVNNAAEWLPNFRTLASKHAECAILRMGPVRACREFELFMDREQVCSSVLSSFPRKGLFEFCRTLWAKHGKELLGDTKILQTFANHLIHQANFGEVNREQVVALIESICGPQVGEIHYLMILKFASIEVFQEKLLPRIGRIMSGGHNHVAWSECGRSGPAAALATAVALHWLQQPAEICRFCACIEDDMKMVQVGGRMNAAGYQTTYGDIETFKKIYGFLIDVHNVQIKSRSQGEQFINALYEHKQWAQMVINASKSKNPVQTLVKDLNQAKQSIPLSFLMFLASSEGLNEHQEPNLLSTYQDILLEGHLRDQLRLQQYLPATDLARKRHLAMTQLIEWLDRTIRKERNLVSAELKAGVEALKGRLDTIAHSSFPQCMGMENIGMDPVLIGAIEVFSCEAHRSDLFDRRARELLRSEVDNPLRILPLAKQQAEALLTNCFAGSGRFGTLKMPSRMADFEAPDFKSEARAVCSLLGRSRVPDSPQDAVCEFLRLAQIDPASLVRWVADLFDFIRDVLKVEDVSNVRDFMSTYGRADITNLPMFNQKIDHECPNLCESYSPFCPSVHHLVSLFENSILFDAKGSPKASTWPQIEDLRHTAPLCQIFRERIRSRQDLKSKMDVLRMMCVSNRHMSRPVDVLDGLAHHLFEISNTRSERDILRHIANLLKSEALSRAAHENISIPQLGLLFGFVDGGVDIAKGNAHLLRSSNIGIDAELLVTIANDPFTKMSPLDTVYVEIGQQGSNVPSFRLVGGSIRSKISGSEIQTLFVELTVQLTVPVPIQRSDDDELLKAVEIAQVRVRRVTELAERLFDYARLGCTQQIEQIKFKFSSQTPERLRNLWESKIECHDDVHDIVDQLRAVSKFDSLRTEYQEIKEKFPWVSFCLPSHIMRRKDTPWLRMLSYIALSISPMECQLLSESEGGRQSVGNVLGWLEQRLSQASCPFDCRIRLETRPQNLMSLEHGVIAVSSMRADGDQLMLRAVALLGGLGELPPRATAIFSCDDSTVPSTILQLVWRLRCASDLLEATGGATHTCERVTRIFLCKGLLIIRPDTLDVASQDLLLAALGRYARVATSASYWCPSVALLLPLSERNRFTELLRSVGNIQIMGDAELDKLDDLGRAVRVDSGFVTVVRTRLGDVCRGLRPSAELVPESAFRIRIGMDTRVADLVVLLQSRPAQDRPIALDFGGNAAAVARGPMAGSLVSLVLCGVIGQAHGVAQLINNFVYFECASTSNEDVGRQVPVLSILTKEHGVSVDKNAELPNDSLVTLVQSFQHLHNLALEGLHIDDALVEKALRILFGCSDGGERRQRLSTPTPFVHTAQSLRTMGIVAERTRCLLKWGSVPADLGVPFPDALPVLLSGDTGTGKTYLLFKFLELLRSSGAVPSLDESVSIYTISAKFQRRQVEQLGKRMRERISVAQGQRGTRTERTVSPFILDEMTGSTAQEALSRLLCSGEICDGESSSTKLPAVSFILQATCNPDPIRDSVFPLTRECQAICIDVPSLSSTESDAFVRSQLQDPHRGPGLDVSLLGAALEIINVSRGCVESSQPPIGTVSLRDAVRCAVLMRRLCNIRLDTGKVVSFFDILGDPVDDWAISDVTMRALTLSCYVCYGMRVMPRASFFRAVQSRCGLNIEKFAGQVKTLLIKHLNFPAFVVETPALEDNLLAAVVAILARLPLLCLGCDGTSKTLSLNLLLSQMQGRFSKSQILQCLPRAQAFNLQLSEQSTADHITRLKKTVVSWSSGTSIPMVFMEEMSMADMGPRGPLRALHDLLDSHQEGRRDRYVEDVGSGSNSFGFLATSNYRADSRELPVGRALGNRMLILAHESLPASSLINLAERVGLRESPLEDDNRCKALKVTLNSLCRTSLVPAMISIRSLLYFSRSLAKGLSDPQVTVEEAQVRAFSSHFQRINRDESDKLLQRIGSMLNWNQTRSWRPTVNDIVSDAFGPLRTRRPLLFLYDSPRDIHAIVAVTTRAYRNVYTSLLEPNSTAEFKKICPSLPKLVAAANHGSSGRFCGIDGSEALFALMQLRAAVERGGLISILNPEPIIEGIHALLNDAGAESSTLQLRQVHENVRIHPSTQLVLLVGRRAAPAMHRAVVSRIAVVNSGIFGWVDNDQPRGPEDGAHSKLLRHYSAVASESSQEWHEEELRLLALSETSFDDFIDGMVPGATLPAGGLFEGAGVGRLAIALMGERVPVMYSHDYRICQVDAMRFSTPALFLEAVTKAVDLLESPSAEQSLLLIDLTAASSASVAECLMFLGFAGVQFASAACPRSLGSRLLRVSARQDRRVVIAVDVSCGPACLPADAPGWKQAEDEATNPPRLRELISFFELREMSRSYPDWPSLGELARRPTILWDKLVGLVRGQLLSTLGSGTGASNDVQTAQPDLLRDAADIALRYCVPDTALGGELLCPDPNRDFSESQLPAPQLHAARVGCFKAALRAVLARSGKEPSLRLELIEMWRGYALTAAAIFLRRVGPSVLAPPAPNVLAYVRRLLAPRTFAWQRSISRQHFQSHRADNARILCPDSKPLTGPACARLPLTRDLLGVLALRISDDGGLLDSSEALRLVLIQAFPTLRGGLQLLGLALPLATALVEDLASGRGLVAGLHPETAAGMLVQASDGTMQSILHTFLRHDRWLAVASHLQPALSGATLPPARRGGLPATVLRAVRESLDAGIAERLWRAEPTGGYAQAIRRAVSLSPPGPVGLDRATDGDLRRTRQLLLLWSLRTSGEKDPVPPNTLRAWSGALDGDAAAVRALLPRSVDAGCSLLARTALDECDAISPLPIPSITAAVASLRPDAAGGGALLASTAGRRGDLEAALRHVRDFLRLALRSAKPGEPVGAQAEVAVAAVAVRELCRGRRIGGLPILRIVESLAPTTVGGGGLAWDGLRLAVGAFVLQAEDVLDAVARPADRRIRPELQALRMHIFADGLYGDRDGDNGVEDVLLPRDSGCGSGEPVVDGATAPLRHFFLRSLVARHDEAGLAPLADRLPHAVGEWVAPFLAPAVDGPLADLAALPGYAELVADGELRGASGEDDGGGWLEALQACLARAGIGGVDVGPSASMWRRQVVDAVAGEELGFCRAPAAAWCVLLHALGPAATPLVSPQFLSEAGGLAGVYAPASPDGPVAMLRRLSGSIGVTTVNRCPCGYVYGIGNCGQPMQTWRCPQCGGVLGGNNHTWATGANHGVADGDDSVRGIAADWFVAGAGHAERGLLPLHYRALSVLLLIPLAVHGPRAAERRRQLRRHWDALRAAASLASDTDTAHFLLGVLARCCAAGAAGARGLAMAGQSFNSPTGRNAAEAAFSRALAELLRGNTPGAIAGEVQDGLRRSEGLRPLARLREARIAGMPPGAAAREFAPRVLRVRGAGGAGEEDGAAARAEALQALRGEVAGGFERFPVLARCLFDEDSDDAPAELARAVDLGAARRLRCLSDLVQGFLMLHRWWPTGAPPARLHSDATLRFR